MLGPEGAATRAADWLRLRLPVRLGILRARYGLTIDSGELPELATVIDFDKLSLGLEEWPAVMVVGQQLAALDPLDVDPATGIETYRARYVVRFYVYARAGDELATDRQRKRLLLAVRETLLERKTLKLLPSYGANPPAVDNLVVDPASFRESYSDITAATDTSETIAAAWLAADVIVLEELEPVTPTNPPTDTTGDGDDDQPPPDGPGMTDHIAERIIVDGHDTRDLPPHPAFT